MAYSWGRLTAGITRAIRNHIRLSDAQERAVSPVRRHTVLMDLGNCFASACFFWIRSLMTNKLPPEPERKKRNRPRPKKSEIWARTGGHCYYCGAPLGSKTEFTTDHILPKVAGGTDAIENLAPTCRTCNTVKGAKSLEEFRTRCAMRSFRKQTGISFSKSQLEYLDSIGVKLAIPSVRFWFEVEHQGCH